MSEHTRRNVTLGFIGLVIAVQLVLPLRYYAGRDRHDERFAWRMFSPMRMTECSYEMRLDGTKVDLGSEFHEAWLELGKRGRFRVIEAMAAHVCSKHVGKPVTVRLECNYIDRPPEVFGGFDLCQVPEI